LHVACPAEISKKNAKVFHCKTVYYN
jgi:hypothetical protein